jgi:hypothetical protein
VEIRLTSTAMHANPLAVHRLQFGLDRKDKHLDVGQDVPAVTAVGAGNATGRSGMTISGIGMAGTGHRSKMVSPGRRHELCLETDPTILGYFAYRF